MRKRKKYSLAEVEITYTAGVGSFNIPSPCLSPLANPFAFDFSFSILPDVISDNIFIPFL